MTPIKLYGAQWCEDTQQTREHLDSLSIPYEYIDVDRDPAAARWVKEHNGGKQRTPTLKLPNLILAEPSQDELDQVLRSHGLLA
jgi:glutaredoxin